MKKIEKQRLKKLKRKEKLEKKHANKFNTTKKSDDEN